MLEHVSLRSSAEGRESAMCTVSYPIDQLRPGTKNKSKLGSIAPPLARTLIARGRTHCGT